MKKLLVLAVLTIAMSLFMSSCGEDEPTGPSEPKIGEMTATVSGSNWVAQNAVYKNQQRSVHGIQADISNPTSPSSKTISVVLLTTDAQPQLKTYTADCFYEESTGMPGSYTLKTWNNASGSCEITEVTDKEIKGTFTFTGTNDDDNSTKTVSGKFYTPRQ